MDDKLTAVIKSVGMLHFSLLLRPPDTAALLRLWLSKKVEQKVCFQETQPQFELVS